MEKYCPRCKITKPTSDFYAHKGRGDGLCGWCKKCMLEYRKQYTPQGKAKIRETVKRCLQSRIRGTKEGQLKLYQYGATFHLYPYCWGVQGTEVEGEETNCGRCKIIRLQRTRGEYALKLHETKTLEQVGKKMGISRQRVAQLIKAYEEAL